LIRKKTVGTLVELKEKGVLPFTFPRDGRPQEGFVIRAGKTLRAYVNRCPHAGTTLDYGDGNVFIEDRTLLMCRTHGALFEPSTGDCVGGPCAGQGLEPLPVAADEKGRVKIF